MKKLGLFMCAIAMVGMCFTSCKKDDNKGEEIDPGKQLTSGMYVFGPATGIATLQEQDAALLGMAFGVNEVTKESRKGMYEKYLVLEGGKDFQFALKEGNNFKYYGGSLQAKKIATDNAEMDGFFGELKEGAKMQVKETGFYHIIMDMCKASELPGGPQIVVVPAELGIAGGMNSWGFTTADKAPKANAGERKLSWTWSAVELLTNAEFKVKTSNCWKINLDDAELVKAETSLGKDMKVGGDNIVVAEGAKYDIVVTFDLAKGDIQNSFKLELKKVGTLEVKDYSKCELELVGDAVADQEGAVADPSSWGWGNVLSMGLPTKEGATYTWTVDAQLLAAGGFKIRTINAEAQGEIQGFDYGTDGQNMTVAQDGTYTVTFTLNAETNEMKAEIAGEGGEVIYPTPEHLYLIGNVNGNDWKPAVGVEMTKDGNTFAVEVTAEGDGTAYFAFTTVQTDDWAVVNANRYGGENDTDVSAGGEFEFFAGEKNFTATTGMKFRVVVDFDAQLVFVTPANE